MKSIITKRWYLVLLVGCVSVLTYEYLLSFFTKDYRVGFFVAVGWLIIWGILLLYFIIVEHSKLLMAVRLYCFFLIICSIILIGAKIYYRIKYGNYYSVVILSSQVVRLLIYILLFIGSKKYISKSPVFEGQNSN